VTPSYNSLGRSWTTFIFDCIDYWDYHTVYQGSRARLRIHDEFEIESLEFVTNSNWLM